MRRAGRWLVLIGLLGCERFSPEPSPASMPARVVEAPTLPPPLIDPAVLAAAVRGGVRQRSANEGLFEVDPFLAALVVEDLRSARPSVTATPVVENGLQTGYRLTGIRDGSVYGSLGLVDGDLVESINGVVLEGPGQAAAAVAGSQRVVALQVTRAGVSSVRELRITPGMAWERTLAVASGAAVPVAPPAEAPAIDPPAIDPPAVDPPDLSPGSGGSGGAHTPGGKPHAPSGTGRAPSGPAPSGGSPPASAAIQCAGDGACTISRREFDAAVADPDRLTRQVQLSPAAGGYRLGGIRPGTQVYQLGFRNGDVVKSINGTSVDNELGLLALYSGLGSTSTYRVGFTRGGLTQSKTIRIR